MSLRNVLSSTCHVLKKWNTVLSLKGITSVGTQHVPCTTLAPRLLSQWRRSNISKMVFNYFHCYFVDGSLSSEM